MSRRLQWGLRVDEGEILVELNIFLKKWARGAWTKFIWCRITIKWGKGGGGVVNGVMNLCLLDRASS